MCMMKDNVFARASKEHAIFKDERALSPEYLPEVLPHRDTQIQTLVYALKPLAEGGNASHVFVFGPPGTGKTVTLKFVMQQLKDFSARVKPVYINCFALNSRQAVLAELTRVVERPVPARGMSTNELYAKVLEGMKFASFVPVLVFDEFDQLLANDGNELLYDLLRLPEHGRKAIPIILISNDTSIPSKLDDRVRSSFSHEAVEFPQYAPPQLKDILRERAKMAMHPDAISEDIISLIAGHAAKHGGDCRKGLDALLKAGKIAERKNANKIEVEHAKEAFEDREVIAVMRAVPFLQIPQKQVLQALFKLGGKNIPSNALYGQMARMGFELSDRRVREIVVELEVKKLLRTETDTSGRGRTKNITVLLPEDALK